MAAVLPLRCSPGQAAVGYRTLGNQMQVSTPRLLSSCVGSSGCMEPDRVAQTIANVITSCLGQIRPRVVPKKAYWHS